MESPIFDMIIGNVDVARALGNPDPVWRSVTAVKNRQHVYAKQKPYPKLKVPEKFKYHTHYVGSTTRQIIG